MATASQVMPHHSPKRRAAIPQAVTTGLGSGSLFGQAVFQDPYFNILKQLKLAQQEPKIEGDVQLIIDRSIGSPVYDLSGFIPAATYIQIPGNSSQSLGLTGSILYIELRRIEAEQHFTIHLDVQTLAANLIVRISFSNLFKERKCSGRVIQIPLTKLTPLKWTVFGIDLKSLISSNSSYEFASLKTIKICSTLQLRGLFTSSNIFTPMTLPREMRLPTVTSEQWIEVYDWLWSPKLPELKKEVTHSADGGNRITEKLPNQSKVRHNGTKSGSSRDPTGDLGAKKDPMLELVRVIGYSGEMPQCLIWLHHNTLVYASMDLIIAHDVEFDQQTILAGHTKDVCVLTMCPFARLLVSGQSGKLPFLIIWDVRTLSAICRVPVFSHGLTDVTISYDARLLACSGHDGQGRVQIVVYDLSQVLETGNVSVVARQTSEFKISRIVFSPHPGSQHQLASCGHESIRFWRIKNGHLPGHSCVLNQHARTTFSALCFEPIYGLLSAAASRPRSLYVATTAGSVFIVDFDSFVIRRVLTLHQDSICTIAVTQGFCAAGSSSGLLQIWPLDFANPIAEIRHHQAVTSLCFSEDGLSIAVGNADGNVGILDIHGGGIRNLVASHSSQILAVCVSPCRNEIGTSSSDRSVRIWNSERFQQVHNIKMEDEDALCLTYHPEQSQLALGFKSGKIRIVDISSGSQIIECHVHSGPVRTIFFTRDGRRLFTASDDRHVYAFDVLRQYQPVRVLAASFTADVSLSCSPDGLRLIMPGPMGNSEVVVYDVDTFSQHQRIDLKDCGCHFVVFHPNGQEILIATTAHDLLRYDQCTRQLLGETRQSKDVAKPITLLRLSPCGNFVVTVDNVNLVRVLQYNSIGNNSCYGQAQEFRMEGPVTAIEFASSDRIVFSVGNAIRMWRFQQDRSDTGEDGRPTPSSFEHVAVVGSPSTFEVATNSRSITHLQPTSPPRRRISQLVTDASKSNVGYTSKYHACYSAPSRVRPAPTVYLVPEETAAVSLQQIVGFNGNGRHNAIWIEDSGQLIFTHGRTIIVEVLFESRQHFLLAHSMEISTLAVSNDLTTLASADGAVNDIGHRASIFLWALDGLTAVSEIATRHANGIQSLAFNCTGEFLLSVGQGPDGILAIWDVATGSCVAAQDHVQQIVMGALWTPLSTDYFITISDHSVELWGMHPSDSQAKSTYSLSRSLLPMTDFKLGNQTSSGGFTAVAFIAKEYLIVGTHVGSVHIWRVHEWSYIGEVALVTFEISSLFGVQGLVTGNRDSTSLMLITAGASDSVHRWTVELSSTPNSKMLVSATGLLRMGTDNCKVASCSWDTLGHVGIVGLDNGNILYANWYSDSEPECQPGIATSVNDDERYPAMAKLITSHTSQILQLRFSPSSEEFASSCCVDGTVRLWNNISSFNDGGHGQCRYRQIMLYQVPNQTCNCICFSSSGVALASGWSDGCVRILNLLQFSVSNKIELGHPVDHLVYSCSGARLFAAANNGVVYVIDGATFELKFQINNHEQCQIDMLDCSQADDSLVLDCDQRARVSIWSTSRIDPNNGYHTSLIKWIAIQDLNAIHNPFFAANDSLNRIKNLADCMLTLLDTESGSYQDAVIHDDSVCAVAVSGNGTILSASGHTLIAHSLAQAVSQY